MLVLCHNIADWWFFRKYTILRGFNSFCDDFVIRFSSWMVRSRVTIKNIQWSSYDMLVTRSVVTWSRWYLKKCSDLIRNASIVDISNARWIKYLPRENYGTKSRVSKRLSILETNHITIFQETILFATTSLYLPSTITNIDSIDIGIRNQEFFIYNTTEQMKK